MSRSTPKISIVTPSFNQAEYLEITIQSVLNQGYPNLEYIIIDGGSTDGSLDIIRKYAKHLAYWKSEPDNGQTHAINEGLQHATGEWVAWQNSDDIYYPGVFAEMANAAARHPEVDLIIGNLMIVDAKGQALRDVRYVTPSYNALRAEGMMMVNQAAFWRRRVHSEIGLLDETLQCSFDYDWFLRITKRYRSVHVNRIWGGFRLHSETKTSNQTQLFTEENNKILKGIQLPMWMVRVYQIRRMALMLFQGDVGYIVRGILRRIVGKQGSLY